LEIEGQYALRLGTNVTKGSGTNYVLDVGSFLVKIHVMKFLMSVKYSGYSDSFEQEGTGGLMWTCSRPGELLRTRRKPPSWEHDGVFKSLIKEIDEPICNAMGQEWQVRDTDPQLFREIRRPVWPHQCRFPAETTISDVRRLTASVDVETAAKVCAEVHKKDSADFEFSIMDVIAMDDVDAAYAW